MLNLMLETFVATFALASFIVAPLCACALYWKERGY